MMEHSFSILSLSMPFEPSTFVRRITLLHSRIMFTQSRETSAWSELTLILYDTRSLDNDDAIETPML
jgi:hypothetical protein